MGLVRLVVLGAAGGGCSARLLERLEGEFVDGLDGIDGLETLEGLENFGDGWLGVSTKGR